MLRRMSTRHKKPEPEPVYQEEQSVQYGSDEDDEYYEDEYYEDEYYEGQEEMVHESFLTAPPGGWLHDDFALSYGEGVYYSFPATYIGSIRLIRSLRSVEFSARNPIVNEAIARLREASGSRDKVEREQIPEAADFFSLGFQPNVKLDECNLSVSTAGIIVATPDQEQILFNHRMTTISFAAGGDFEDYNVIAYVAKSMGKREAHIFDCGALSNQVLATIGQAFVNADEQAMPCEEYQEVEEEYQQLEEDYDGNYEALEEHVKSNYGATGAGGDDQYGQAAADPQYDEANAGSSTASNKGRPEPSYDLGRAAHYTPRLAGAAHPNRGIIMQDDGNYGELDDTGNYGQVDDGHYGQIDGDDGEYGTIDGPGADSKPPLPPPNHMPPPPKYDAAQMQQQPTYDTADNPTAGEGIYDEANYKPAAAPAHAEYDTADAVGASSAGAQPIYGTASQGYTKMSAPAEPGAPADGSYGTIDQADTGDYGEVNIPEGDANYADVDEWSQAAKDAKADKPSPEESGVYCDDLGPGEPDKEDYLTIQAPGQGRMAAKLNRAQAAVNANRAKAAEKKAISEADKMRVASISKATMLVNKLNKKLDTQPGREPAWAYFDPDKLKKESG